MKNLKFRYSFISSFILIGFVLHILISCSYLNGKVICETNGKYSVENIDGNGNCEHNTSSGFFSENLFAYSHCKDIQLINHSNDDYRQSAHNNSKISYLIFTNLIQKSIVSNNDYLSKVKNVPIQLLSIQIIIKSTSSLLI